MANHDRITLRANDGHYVEVNTGVFSSRDLRATASSSHGFWQTFKVHHLGGSKVTLQAWDGKYVCAENSGGRELTASRDVIGPWETFTLAQLGGGNVSLQASNGQYVCAENSGGRELVANRGAVGPWESFQMTPVVRYMAAAQCAILGVGGGGVTANFDFGAGDKYIFNGSLAGVAAAAGFGTAEFHVAPEDLAGLGAVNIQVITTIGYFTFGWQRLNGYPIGEVQCGGLTLPGGGAGQGVFVHA